jgi:hypothetical protein
MESHRTRRWVVIVVVVGVDLARQLSTWRGSGQPGEAAVVVVVVGVDLARQRSSTWRGSSRRR